MSAPDAERPTSPIVGRIYLERGQPVTVLTGWASGGGPRNVRIRRTDGTEVVRPFRGLRRTCGHRDPVWDRTCTLQPHDGGIHQDRSTPGDLLAWGTAAEVRAYERAREDPDAE